MTGRIAARALPKEVPAFFRKADVELGYLCPEPDRWRNAEREPALRGAVDRDHIVMLEQLPEKLPAHRYDFFQEMTRKPRPDGKSFGWREAGFAPYAIAERMEHLTVSFMMWRKAGTRTAEERRIRRQIEQNIIHVAGVLGHFVTDLGMPLHTTIHLDGWHGSAPNPNGYSGRGVHGRFEDDCVDRAMEEKDVAKLVGAPRPRPARWLDEAMAHARESHAHVERVYALDKAQPFGSGNETPEQLQFVRERLAFSAAALRDFWYAAWVRSEALPEGKSLTEYFPETPPRAKR
jgi:hypothetical protein